ncbi:MAG: hemerythrin domain-containing protein [Trebonia sp.]
MTITYEGATEEVRRIVHHHAVLRRGVERRAGTVCDAAASGVPHGRQLALLREYLNAEVLPHVAAEERTLNRAAAAQAGSGELVRELTAEHDALAYLAGRLQPSADATEAASIAEWIATLFAGHVAKVNDRLLPALTGSGADLTALLADMHHVQAGARV